MTLVAKHGRQHFSATAMGRVRKRTGYTLSAVGLFGLGRDARRWPCVCIC